MPFGFSWRRQRTPQLLASDLEQLQLLQEQLRIGVFALPTKLTPQQMQARQILEALPAAVENAEAMRETRALVLCLKPEDYRIVPCDPPKGHWWNCEYMVEGKKYWYGCETWTEGYATICLSGTCRWIYLLLQEAELNPTITHGEHIANGSCHHFDLWVQWDDVSARPPEKHITVLT